MILAWPVHGSRSAKDSRGLSWPKNGMTVRKAHQNIPPWERGATRSNRWLVLWAIAMTVCVVILGWVVWSFRRSPGAA